MSERIPWDLVRTLLNPTWLLLWDTPMSSYGIHLHVSVITPWKSAKQLPEKYHCPHGSHWLLSNKTFCKGEHPRGSQNYGDYGPGRTPAQTPLSSTLFIAMFLSETSVLQYRMRVFIEIDTSRDHSAFCDHRRRCPAIEVPESTQPFVTTADIRR